jgi:ATP-binding cassette subfamily E protein 1
MADLVHIMYGKEGAYGVVSQPKPARTGINVYLDGYLREENVRFRDQKIKFEIRPPHDGKAAEGLVEWPELRKRQGQFELVAEPGIVYRHETVGVLGENAIGKTTLVKMLAGKEEPDSGKVKETEVAYKPQYLDTENDELVASFLARAVQKYTNELINPLSLKPLLARPLCTLSGGQLQRVNIAKALSEDAQLVLLDEPSAYLDVEQRLLASKIIRSIAQQRGLSVMVVDHDLVFIDYLSSRLLVFDGEPAIRGRAMGPFSMEQGMNSLLKEVDITLRRDPESARPRINKPGSQKDQEQKKSGKYYYS